MISEYCPKCNSIADMTINKTEKFEKDSYGNNLKIITSSYHCSLCHTFVRSEDINYKNIE